MLEGLDNGGFRMSWVNWVPLKCNIFAWRAEGHQIPTKIELHKRNVSVGSTICPLCEDGSESVEHLFTGCSIALEVWCRITKWCGIPNGFFFDVRDLLEIGKLTSGSKKKRKVINGIVIATIWCVWLARNNKVFN